MSLIPPLLAEILVCPVDKASLVEDDDRLECSQCGLRFPIRDGVPVMLVDQAEGSRS